MKLPLVTEADVKNKTVFLRADLDVPLTKLKTQNSPASPSEAGRAKLKTQVEDDTRLRAGLPTIEYLVKSEAVVIIGSKLGRPNGVDLALSLKPVAQWLVRRFKNKDLRFTKKKMDGFDGWEITPKLFLLENLRFYKGEGENDPAFAKQLAELAQIYVNDSFAVSHRTHASIVGIPKYLPHFAGLRLQKEVEVLSSAMENPERPLVVVIGGAKMETKVPVVAKMHQIADYVLVGGKIANDSKTLLKVEHEKTGQNKAILLVGDLNSEGTDLTKESFKKFLSIIALAKTIIWNGPVGLIENEDCQQATRELALAIAKSRAYTIVGGGDTAGFLKKIGLLDKFSFVSVGGGAMLDFLAGEKLPGIEALLK